MTSQRRLTGFGRRFCLGVLGTGVLLAASLEAQEFRALWVDTFHTGIRSNSEVTQLIADARAGNFNVLVVEVRKRGDAYYTSNYEPKATDTPQDFDSLSNIIAQAHNTNTGQRLEVHAWIVTYPIWNKIDRNAAPAGHVVRLHPEWLTKDTTGTNWVLSDPSTGAGNYNLDPGHPGVQQHNFNVCMDIINRYDVDGFNFDYVRYPGNEWGYNDVAVSRFNARLSRTGPPPRTDPAWLQFRRDQVTALVRKVYLSAIALKPQIKISADTITWGTTAPATDTAWTNSSSAYTDVLQDWRSWMEEGILDLNMPMTYYDQAINAAAWAGWDHFAKDHRYQRGVIIGPALYKNGLSNVLYQLRDTRTLSPGGNHADGLCGFSYAVPMTNNLPRSAFLEALTQTNVARQYDPNPDPLFYAQATVPGTPWKTASKGHLKGFACGGSTTNPLDGVTVTLSGPTNRTTFSDATGFYGWVDLPPGSYTVSATLPGFGTASSNVTITARAVSTADLLVPTNDTTPPVLSGVRATNITDTTALILWTTDEAADSLVEYGTTASYGRASTNPALVSNHSMALAGLNPSTTYHFRVKSKDDSDNQAVSGDFAFTTLPDGVVNDIIIDNPAAGVVGSWQTGNTSSDRYGADYRYKSQGDGFAYLEYTPNILTAGAYDVSEWHPAGGNRTTDAPYVISSDGGTTTVSVNQKNNGGQWNLLGTFNFAAGINGNVRITDGYSDGNPVVIADALKFVFVPPPAITVPPQSQSVTVGTSVSFSVSASGRAPCGYQWRFNGTPISGATASGFTHTNVQPYHAGLYSVAVSNIGGITVSANAALTVNVPPTILTQPQGQTAKTGSNTTFRVTATGTAPLSYQWWFNGTAITGAVANSYTLTNAQPADAGNYSVAVSNVAGRVVSSNAPLAVVPSQPIRIQSISLLSGSRVKLVLEGEPGFSYVVENSSSLTNWFDLGTVANTNGAVDFFDTLAPENPRRFYRVRLAP